MGKNVAIICNYILKPNRIGGMDRFFVNFDKTLKKNGYKVDWFFKDYEAFDFYKELTIYSANSKSVEQQFIKYSEDNRKEYQIIITHFTSLCTKFYKKYKKIHANSRIIAVDHNPRPLHGFTLKKRIKNRIKGLLYGRYIDELIGVSDYTTNYILKDYGLHLKSKSFTVHNGIDTSSCIKQSLNRIEKPFKFIVVSHLRESKGIQDLLKALSLIRKDFYPFIKVDIYGEGPFENSLREMQQLYNIASIVSFKGSSPKIYKKLFQYHYLIQPTYMECFSLSLLESLACNVPVITTTVGGNLEVVQNGENGFIFKPGDVLKLKNIIEAIVSTNQSISMNTSKLIESNFNIDKMVKEHFNSIL